MELLTDQNFLMAVGTVLTAVLGVLGGKKLQSANANKTNADTYSELSEIIRETTDKCTELAHQVSDLLMRVGTVEAENASLKQQLADAKDKIAALVTELEHLRVLAGQGSQVSTG
ncbi:MAG TPA: hypothetical protein VIY48_18500 [Candidatus Paceibacterota bacterium]